jgi:TRAP-type C4-dicarboxylate transport system permease small subunit
LATITVVFILLLIFGGLLTYLGYRASTSTYRGMSYLSISLLFLVGGFFFWPLWIGVVLGPLFFFILSPRVPSSTRWDKLDAEREEPSPERVAAARDAAQKTLAQGRCPSCGAKFKGDADRCRVCGSYLKLP